MLVLEQVGEVVGHAEARAAEWRSFWSLRLGALLQLLPPPGLVLVVGIVNGVLDPQTFSFLHVWTLLSQGHGLPGFSCKEHSLMSDLYIHQEIKNSDIMIPNMREVNTKILLEWISQMLFNLNSNYLNHVITKYFA